MFTGLTDAEMFEIFKDILGSRELGIRPRSLDVYAEKVRESSLISLAEASDFVEKLFF